MNLSSTGVGVATVLQREIVSPARGAVRPRTVCHLIASSFFGGPEKQIVEHAGSLDATRWQAVVASFRENRDSVDVTREAELRGLPTFLIDTRSPFSPGAVLQLRQHLRETHADVLVTHGYKSTVVGSIASFLERVPQVVVVRGFTGEDWKVRIYEAIDRWFIKRARYVVCVSQGTRRLMIDHGLKADRVVAIHNAVKLDTIVSAPARLRQEFGIGPDEPLILAVGRLSPEKGQRYLLTALGLLNRRGLKFHLVVLGDGKERPALEALSRTEGISDRVHWAGFRTDVLACMKEAGLLVNPSSTEGLPNVILEAFAAGLPVVATDVGGTAELVLPEKTGWLVPKEDPEAMADAIGEAIHNREVAQAMAEEAGRYVRDEFTFSHQAGQLMDLYDKVIGGSRCTR